MRSLPLPAYFGAYGTMLSTILALGWTVQLDPGSPGRWNDPSAVWMLLLLVEMPVATFLTIREARRRKRSHVEDARYRAAVLAGEPRGHVSHWAEWMRRDRRQAWALAIISVLGVGWWGVHAVLVGPWWTGADMALVASCCVWLAWRILRNLHQLRRYVLVSSQDSALPPGTNTSPRRHR